MSLWQFHILRRLLRFIVGQNTRNEAQNNRIERKVDKVMALADDLKSEIANFKREVQETTDAFNEKISRIEQLIQQGAADAEVRAAVEEVLPELRAGVASLDALNNPPTT